MAGTGQEARRAPAGRVRVADTVGSVVLLVVQLATAVVAGWGIVLLSLGFVSCSVPGNRCDRTLGGAVVYGGPVVVALLFVAALVLVMVRLARRRTTWPVPVLGIVLTVGVFLLARILIGVAVTHGI